SRSGAPAAVRSSPRGVACGTDPVETGGRDQAVVVEVDFIDSGAGGCPRAGEEIIGPLHLRIEYAHAGSKEAPDANLCSGGDKIARDGVDAAVVHTHHHPIADLCERSDVA